MKILCSTDKSIAPNLKKIYVVGIGISLTNGPKYAGSVGKGNTIFLKRATSRRNSCGSSQLVSTKRLGDIQAMLLTSI